MQEGPGAVTLTTKQLASSVTEERTNQQQGAKRFSNICKFQAKLLHKNKTVLVADRELFYEFNHKIDIICCISLNTFTLPSGESLPHVSELVKADPAGQIQHHIILSRLYLLPPEKIPSLLEVLGVSHVHIYSILEICSVFWECNFSFSFLHFDP